MNKQVIVLRRDLNMRLGKSCSQAAHASMAFMTKRLMLFKTVPTIGSLELSPEEKEWIKGTFTKIVVGAGSEQELRDLQAKALEAGLEAHLITDNGLTEFAGVPTVTALAIGPAHEDKINPITGHLKLL